MKKLLLLTLSALCLFGFTDDPKKPRVIPPKSFYDLSVKSLDGTKDINFSEFKGKKVLIVNTASQCGFTKQYTGLQQLYLENKDRLVIIGFPCNQFGEQEPWEADRIQNFCSGRYKVTFPMAEKVEVKPGENQHPVYQWLTQKRYNKKQDVEVRWNFGKFLVDENGRFVAYFPSETTPQDPALVAQVKATAGK